MPHIKVRSSARVDAMKQELDVLAAELSDAHAMLDRFGVGKPAWSLAGRIELLGELVANLQSQLSTYKASK